MIKAIRRVTILAIGVGAGFGAGYLKATNDLDPEFLQDMRKLGRDFYTEVFEAVRIDTEQRRKQTEIFADTAEAMLDLANKKTNDEQGETS